MKTGKFVGIIVGVVIVSAVLLNGCIGSTTAKCSHEDLKIDFTAIADKKPVFSIVIVGSGPAGLTSALYGARANIKTMVIEGDKPGGQLTETSFVENWPGSKPLLGREIIQGLREQAASFGATFLQDSVERVDCSRWPFEVYTEDGKKLYALSLIVATGASPRKLGISGEKEYWGEGVTACAICDAPFYKKQDVVVIGGGDSAVEEAIQLSFYAKNITILVRDDHMRAAASMQKRLQGYPNISVKYNVKPQRIIGDGEQVTGIELLDTITQEVSTMPTAGVFLAIGHDPNSGIFKDSVHMDEHGYIIVHDRSQATSVRGLFAAGDVNDNTYRQAGVAAGDGIKAALDAISFLNEVGFNADVAARLEKKDVMSDVEQNEEVLSINSLSELEDTIATSTVPVVVDFFADYCPSCLQMLPIIDSVAHHFASQATFVKVDTEEATDIVEKFFVHKVPCLLVFNDGKLVARYNATMGRKELGEFVKQFILLR